LGAQSFRAPFHLSKPYWDEAAKTLLVQVVNPTAGILSGDRLESAIAVESGASLLVTTPSASRVFHMREGSAENSQRFSVARDGWLEVMPEPLVPHRKSRYRQRTQIDVAEGGRLFFADLLMPGRIAHGEAWSWDQLTIDTEVSVGGELVLRERFHHAGAELKALANLAGSGETACFGNGILIAEDSRAAWLAELRGLHGDGLWLGVSALRKSGWSVKWVARDGVRMREALKQIRAVLARTFPAMTCDPRKL
jgi:urease accessory protein